MSTRPLTEDDGFIPSPPMQSAGKGEKDEFGSPGDIGRGAVDEITGLLDIPGNVTKWGLRQLGAKEFAGESDYIRRQAASVGIANPVGKEPDNFAGSIGRVIGGSIATAVPIVGPGARLAATAATTGRGAATVAGNVVQNIGKAAIDHPAKFLAYEVGAATAAGIGGQSMAKEFPETPAARAWGEIIGGIGGPLTAGVAMNPVRSVTSVVEMSPILGTMVRGIRKTVSGLKPEGAMSRAKERFQSFADPEDVRTGMNDPNLLPDAPLTPAQKSGDPNLLSFERSIMESTMELQGERRAQFSSLNTFLRDSLKGDGSATVDDARLYFQTLIDSRLRIAVARADERLTALGPRVTSEEANILAREEIDRALQAGKAQERQLWNAVPKDISVPTNQTTQSFKNMMDSVPKAQQEDIPNVARNILGGEKPIIGDSTTVNELQGLRSKLLEESRIARENKQFNKARLADEMADAVLNDLGATRNAVKGPAGDSLRIALDFSADLSNRFRKGAVGRLLGQDRDGGMTTAPGLMLKESIGRAGPRAREEADALLSAAERTGDQPALRGYMEDYIRDEFKRRTVRNGVVDPALGQGYLRERQDLLQRFPQLRGDMETAVATGMELRTAQKVANPELSAAAVFLKSEPGAEIRNVIKSPNPKGQMEALLVQARNDTSGQAERGVKAAFTEFLFENAAVSGVDATGARFISGTRFRELLNDPKIKSAAMGTFSEAERGRLLRIAETASRLDAARDAGSVPGKIMPDSTNMLTSTVAAILGARVGRALNTGTIQAPGKMAALFQRVFKAGIKDPAEKLIIDSIRDETLFRAMFTPIRTRADAKAVNSRLNGWASSVIRDMGAQEEATQE